MKKSRITLLSAVLLVFLIVIYASMPAFAERGIDLDHKGSITMSCAYKGKPVSGGDLRLYKVAEVEQEDGSYYFRLRSDLLSGQRLDQKALDAPNLTERIAADPDLGKPQQTAVFNQKGIVTFKDLTPGLYLLMQSKPAAGYEKMLPVLVSLPWFDEKTDGYLYDIDATVKPETARTPTPTPTPTPKPGPKIPQTGQLNWPVPVLAGLGVILLIIGTVLLTSERPRKKEDMGHG